MARQHDLVSFQAALIRDHYCLAIAIPSDSTDLPHYLINGNSNLSHKDKTFLGAYD